MPAPGPGFAGGMHGGGHYYAYEGDISPEDIFRAMFGFHPGMGGARTVYRRHPRRPHNGEEDEGRKFFFFAPTRGKINKACLVPCSRQWDWAALRTATIAVAWVVPSFIRWTSSREV